MISTLLAFGNLFGGWVHMEWTLKSRYIYGFMMETFYTSIKYPHVYLLPKHFLYLFLDISYHAKYQYVEYSIFWSMVIIQKVPHVKVTYPIRDWEGKWVTTPNFSCCENIFLFIKYIFSTLQNLVILKN